MGTNRHENSINTFFAILRAGLWADVESMDIRIQGFSESVDWNNVYQLAEEQSVVGLVAAGFDYVVDKKVPQEILLQIVGEALQIEQQNAAMNNFIGTIVEKMRSAGIYTLLVKGQGVAQCYEKPQWRASGDVDFYLSHDNYEKAKAYLTPLAQSLEPEGKYQKHLNMTILENFLRPNGSKRPEVERGTSGQGRADSWVVELHGSMRCGLSRRMDRVMDEIHRDLFYGGCVRSWQNGQTQVFLPSAGNDVMIVFTHYLKHFFKGGIGLRQICDWCRLLWTYKDSLNYALLESRIRKAGLMSEWKAFGAFAVEYLGVPKEGMPFCTANGRWKHKAKMIKYLTLDSNNIEQNRDISYFAQYPYVIRKAISFGRRCGDLYRVAKVFPMDSLRFFPYIMFNGLRSVVRRE